MSDIKFHQSTPHLTLPEYEVGVAAMSCEFPGIAQCIAVVGALPSAMICAHVSPGTTAEQMKDIFAYLRAGGGDDVDFWYLLGPTEHHFTGRSTLWKSLRDIRKTFRKRLDDKNTTHLFLDATEERNSMVDFPEFTQKVRIASIDIRALNLGGLRFSWRLRESRAKTRGGWNDFDLRKFKPI